MCLSIFWWDNNFGCDGKYVSQITEDKKKGEVNKFNGEVEDALITPVARSVVPAKCKRARNGGKISNKKAKQPNFCTVKLSVSVCSNGSESILPSQHKRGNSTCISIQFTPIKYSNNNKRWRKTHFPSSLSLFPSFHLILSCVFVAPQTSFCLLSGVTF